MKGFFCQSKIRTPLCLIKKSRYAIFDFLLLLPHYATSFVTIKFKNKNLGVSASRPGFSGFRSRCIASLALPFGTLAPQRLTPPFQSLTLSLSIRRKTLPQQLTIFTL